MNKKSVKWAVPGALLFCIAASYAATVASNTASSTGTTTSGLVVIPTTSTTSAAAVPAAANGDLVAGDGSKTLTIDPAALTPPATAYIGGVQTHFAYAKNANYSIVKSAELINALGMNSYRDDIYWNAFAPNWDLLGAHLPAELTDFWGRVQARPLMIVNNGNPYVPGTTPPITEDGRAKFAGFASRAAAATMHKSAIYEVWNEWNMNAVQGRPRIVGAGEANDPRAAIYYAPLAQASSKAIRAQAPAATILVGATGDDEGWGWTREVIKLGGLQYADGLSVHMYNHCQAPRLRTATEFVDRLDDLRARIADLPGGTKPIYITEWGWPTGTNVCSLDSKDAAKNIAQFYLWSAATPWIGGSWYYELKDSGKDPANIQDNFGLYDYNNLGKPGSCMAREAMALIKASKGMAVERPFKDMFVVKIRTSWGYQIVSWTTSTEKTGTVRVGGTMAFAARAMCGNDRAISATREVVVGPNPVVMTFVSTKANQLFVKQ